MRLLVACVLGLFVCGVGAADWLAATIAMPAVQVGSHCWYGQGALEEVSTANQGFMSNAGFVITTGGVVIFDALGSPALADRLIAEIRRHPSQPIRRAIISHFHADHFYGIAALCAAGAEVWVPTRAKEYLTSDAAERRLVERRQTLGRWLGPGFKPPRPERWLSADEDFTLGGMQFQLRYVGPGHAPEDLVMLVAADQVLFSGDTVHR